jgi:hypothetical protein
MTGNKSNKTGNIKTENIKQSDRVKATHVLVLTVKEIV